MSGPRQLNVGNTIPTHSNSHHYSMCDLIFAQGDGTPWYTFQPPIESLYEVVVVADYGYGYKRVGSNT